MNKTIVTVMGLVLGVCISAQAAYRTEVKVTPSTEPHLFVVEFKIVDVAKDGKMTVLSAPKMAVKADQEGKINVVNEKEESGVFCTALVKETDDSVEVTTTVIVKDKGLEKLNNAQIVTLKR
jgi:hypothetical protein